MQINSLHGRISKLAAETPNKTAIEYGTQEITYSQLEQYSNKIANFFIENSIEDKKIPIIIDKGIDLIAGILGIIKSGNIFVPIDPNYPLNRIKMILNETASDWVLAQSNTVLDMEEITGGITCINTLLIGTSAEKTVKTAAVQISYSEEQCSLIKENILNKHCYVYFTSGSTGKPKGILGRHRSLCHYIQWEIEEFGIDQSFRVSQLTSPSFDPFLRDVFVPLCAGGTLCIPEDKEIILNPKRLISWLNDSRISLSHMVPVLFRNMVANLDTDTAFDSLKYILLAGELLRGNDIKKFVDIFDERIQLVNIYGPTETTLAKFFYRISKEDTIKNIIPVGRPITFTEALILDGEFARCAVNVIGEIYIRTPFISSGYFNDRELTKKVFLKNPLANNDQDIIYRTGDLGRLLTDGNIEVLGRADNQVKIRGVRIELAEIEALLLKYSNVKNAVVAAREDDEGSKYLCAYVVLDKLQCQNNTLELNKIKEYLKEQIPEYMVPAYFMEMQELPLTPNGKIDRSNLPEPDMACSTAAAYEAPENEIEEALAVIWRDILKIDKIGVNDNFFDIGGHSLKAANMLLAIINKFNIEISLKQIFQHPTIRELSKILQNSEESIISAINPAVKAEYYPLSSAQKRLYALQAFENNNISYNIQKKVRIFGKLRLEAVKKAFAAIIERHEVLRTSFMLRESEIVQVVHESLETEVEYMKVSQSCEADAFEGQFVREFDLSKAPLIRMGIMELGREEFVLLIDMHHIISDGSSVAVLIKDFISLYKAEELQPLKIQYKDYAVWQNQLLKSETMQRQEEYWINIFKNDIPVLALSADYQRPSVQSFEGSRLYFSLDKEMVQGLHNIMKETGSTLYVVLLTAFNILLSKYSGQEDIVIGSPIAGRQYTNLDNVIGMFVNTLAMRNHPQNNKTLSQFLLEVKENALKAFENQDYQFEELVDKLNIKRDMSRNPLFDVMFVMQNIEMEEFNLEGLTFKLYNPYNSISKFDITLQAIENNEEIELCMEYCIRLFKRESIERMAEHLKNIIKEMTADIDKRLSEIDMLSKEEKHKLLYEFNETAADYPKHKTIHQLFEEQVQKTPDNIAVVYEEDVSNSTSNSISNSISLTYRELNAKANQLARLLRAEGVKADTIVAMAAEKSAEMIIGILGILKAGGAYLPIDPEYPTDRIEYTIKDSGAGILLTSGSAIKELSTAFGEKMSTAFSQKLSAAYGDKLKVIDLEAESSYQGEADNLEIINKAEDMAYVIYTSGTTGRPKGAIIEHRNVVRLMFNDKMQFDFRETDVWTMFHSYCFDFSVWEMYGALLYGGKLIVISKTTARDVWEYLRVLREYKVTILNQTPSAFYRLIEEEQKSSERQLETRYVIFGGEALKPIMLKEYKERYPTTKLINMYGITETTVHVTYKEIGKEEIEGNISNIGKPIPTLTAYIMDKEMKLMPIGAAGELCVGGEGLGRGYLNRDELTGERFVINPYKPEERLYKSGDLARLLPNGEMEYLGRIDHQVKIRGFRIELGEIESRLLSKEEIQEAVVAAKEDSTGSSYLCAYYVVKASFQHQPPAISELREFLAAQLPDYMLPSYFVQIDKVPLNSNGKIDIKALPQVDRVINTGKEYAAPENKVQEKLISIWEDTLKVKNIGINDNFFELGGHSLKAAAMIANIHKELNVQIPLKQIFSIPTVKGLSEYIKNLKKSTYATIEPLEEKEYYELSSAQKRLYLLQQMDKNGVAYNMSGAFLMEGALDIERLKEAFNKLIDRHEVFRTYFELLGEEVVQKIKGNVQLDINLEAVEEKDIQGIVNNFIRPFDLSKAPLIRVGLIELVTDSSDIENGKLPPKQQHCFEGMENRKILPKQHLVLLDMHHIISDGISMGILVDEFLKLYEGAVLPEQKLQYKDYAAWLNKNENIQKIEQQEKYWLDLFKDKLPVLDMPCDSERLSAQSFNGNAIPFIIDKQTTAKMQELASKNNTTLNTILMSFYSILLAKYSGQQDIILGSTIANRAHAELQAVIGPFINFVPIRSKVDDNMKFTEFILQQKTVIEAAYDNQEYPFDRLVEKLRYKIKGNRNPIFDTMLIYHNELEQSREYAASGLKFSQYAFKKKTSTLDFKLDVYKDEDSTLSCILEYNTDLFREQTIAELIKHYKLLISRLLENAEQKISELEIFTLEEKLQLETKTQINKKDVITIPLAVSATFTAEPIEEYIKYWGNQNDYRIDISFAPYNQVFQELLDSDSLTSANTGINAIMVRFEDWIRDSASEDDTKTEILQRNYQSLLQAVQGKADTIPYIAAIFPVSTHLPLSNKIKDCIERLNEKWLEDLQKLEHVSILDLRSAASLYGISETHNALTDAAGHMPFTDEYYAAIGTLLARKLRSIRSNPFKVIAVDCDNTLWRGICGEDGSLGISIDKPYSELQKFLIKKQEEGMLIVLCSKNNEEDVWEVFDKNPDMLLKREHLSSWRINWDSKSDNMKQLAEELDLGIDSFIFIDDSAAECYQMMLNNPKVLTLQLPEDAKQIPLFLQHVWVFDKDRITAEDKMRTRSYQAERQRKQIQNSASSMQDFLRELRPKIYINHASKIEIPRLAQLTQRTNQFNLSTKRRTEEEIQALANKSDTVCWAVEVEDKFGIYGLTGLVIFEKHQETIFIDTYLLSCRVLGRAVEHAILSELAGYCIREGIQKIQTDYYPTQKNQQVKAYLEKTKWNKIQETDKLISYEINPRDIEAPEAYVECIMGRHCETAAYKGMEIDTANSTAAAAETKHSEGNIQTVTANWNLNIDNEIEEKLLHRQYLQPLKYSTGSKLLQLPAAITGRKARAADFEAANTALEKAVEGIWKQVLKTDTISINDDFFQIGGHSLKATSLAAKIHKSLNAEISLSDIFSAPTIKSMAELIQKRQQSQYASIEPVENKEVYEVSSAQKRLYTLQQFDIQNISYNIPAIFIVEGSLNAEKLEGAFNRLIQRHEVLRTCFAVKGEDILQIIKEDINVAIENYNSVQAENINQYVKAFIRPFDLNTAPLLRVGLGELSQDKYLLMFDMHHIISDGTSMGILIKELMALYEGAYIAPLRLQYKDYAAWQNKLIRSEAIKHQEKYWMECFAGDIPVINLPTDYPRPSIQSFEGNKLYFQLDRDITEGLRSIAHKNGATLYMVLLSAINILLAKYSSQEDIVIGSPIAGRPHADLDNLIGMFVNTLAMRNYPQANKGFLDFLGEVKVNALKAYENQAYQFEELVEKLNIRRDMSRNPVFDVMFGLQNTDIDSLQMDQLSFHRYSGQKTISKFDITIDAVEVDEIIEVSMEYCTKLFKKETIERMSEHLINILSNIINNPQLQIKDIEILSQREKQQILQAFNLTDTNYPKNKTLQQLFEEQAEQNPDNTAVVYGDTCLTYRELNNKSNILARLLRSKGVTKDSIVGIMLERSLEMIIGIMAVLKAGGAYLPLDPAFPKDRVEYMLKDSNSKLLLTQPEYMRGFEAIAESINICSSELYKGDDSSLELSGEANDLAYVMYTSGSTGEPKGIETTHYNISRIAIETNYIKLTSRDRILQLSNYAFDGSTFDIFGALLNGSTLYIIDKEIIVDLEKLGKYIEQNGITIFFVTTALFNTIIDVIPQYLNGVKKILFGGERVSVSHVRKALEYLGGNRLAHVYGPTESTVFATYHNVINIDDDIVTIPIGRPVANTQVYIMDRHNKLLPVGVPGELCIGGCGLAKGYLNRQKLTEESFIDNPFRPGSKLYKSGDLAKWHADGSIEFLDRMDGQVKIRGFRIELGEIENKLTKCEGIKEAVVVPYVENGSNKHLCAYFTSDIALNTVDIRAQLSKVLPDYMVPVYYMQLDKLPVNQNGKVDKKALPTLEAAESGVEYTPPSNDVEEKLVLVWQEITKLQKVGTTDNFFALGGDSIKAIQVSARMQRYGYKVQVGDIIKYPTISELSKYADKYDKLAEQGSITGQAELTPIQHWFFEQNYTNKNHWNHAVMLYRKAGFDEGILRTVFSKIIEHHDMLRCTYAYNNGEVIQEIRGIDAPQYTFEVHDFSKQEIDPSIITQAAERLQASMDLQKGPLVKLGLFKTKAGDHLLIAVHHLIIDGVSWRILFEDLTSGYKQIQEGKAIELPAKTTSFKEWSKALRVYANSTEIQQELDYWHKAASNSIEAINKASSVEARRLKDSRTVPVQLTEEETANLLMDVNNTYKTEINDILLTALGIALNKWAGLKKAAISLEGHGREAIGECDVSRTIGWFTAVYPVVLDICHTEQIGNQIKHIKESLRKIPQKGIGYGILKYLRSSDCAEASAFEIDPQISFNYLGQFDSDIKTDVFETSSISAGKIMDEAIETKYALAIDGMVIDRKLTLSISYQVMEFNELDIKEFAEALKDSLQAVIKHCMEKEAAELTPSDISANMFDIEELDQLFDIFEDQINQ